MHPVIETVNITKRFGSIIAVDNISLQIKTGEKLVIIGPSGSGKSTFLRCLNGLELADSGRILLDGNLVDYRAPASHIFRRDIGMVFQNFELFSHLDVLQNLILAQRKVKRIPAILADKTASEFLNLVGMTEKIHAFPGQLSGGQKQRVAIARALCLKPKLILFDEPTSALDPEMISEVLVVMRQLASDGMTMVVVTHEIGFAREIADTVAFYESGRFIEYGLANDILDTAKHPRTIEFLSKVLKQ